MTSRERVIRTIQHQEPDRVPLDIEMREEVLNQLKEKIGTQDLERINQYLHIDIRKARIKPGKNFLKKRAFFHPRNKWVIRVGSKTYEDEWGIRYRTDEENRYFGFHSHPLGGAKSLKGYMFPDLSDDSRFEEVKRTIREFGQDYAIMGIAGSTLFEIAWQLRGYRDFILDLCDNSSFASELLDRLVDYRKTQCKRYLELGVDIIYLGDDFGMQDRMMINPDLWREYFKPRMKELISDYSTGHKVFTLYHSDGYIEPIIEDLIEIGVDILNPIQPESMDPYEIKKKYGNRITLHGTISIQRLLLQGSREEVAEKVRQIIRCCAPGGGLILAPTHTIQPDIPIENILTFYRVAFEEGRYL